MGRGIENRAPGGKLTANELEVLLSLPSEHLGTIIERENLEHLCPEEKMTTKDLIDEALSLPVEDRALIADAVLRSLNAPDVEIDREWFELALRRRDELRSGKAQTVAGEDVFERIRRRYGS